MVVEIFETRGFDPHQTEIMRFGTYEGISHTFEENVEGRRFQRTIMLYQTETGFIVAGYISSLADYDVNTADKTELARALETVTQETTFEFFEGTIITIPEGWQLTDDQNDGFYARSELSNGTITFNVIIWPGYGAMSGLEAPADFLAWIFDENFGHIERLNRSKIQAIKLAGFEAALYPLSSDKLNGQGLFDRSVIAVSFPSNNSTFTVNVMTESLEEPIEPVFEVLDTIQPGRKTVCALFASQGIRIREEPTTNSEVVRQTDREVLIAVRKTSDSAGYVWFDVGEGWIRSDVIYHENSSCNDIPFR